MNKPLVTKPFERPDVSDRQVTKQFERPYVSNERMANPFERNEFSNERVTKLFERPDVSNEWVIKSFEQLDKRLVNGKTLVYVFPWKVTAPNIYSSLLTFIFNFFLIYSFFQMQT